MAKREVNFQFIFDSGKQSTLAGFGRMYDEFLNSGEIIEYTGKGREPAIKSEPYFHVASVRKMQFVDTFDGVRYNVSDSKCLFDVLLEYLIF